MYNETLDLILEKKLIVILRNVEESKLIPLQDALYDRKTTDAANALRINASRLRKLLMQSELPVHRGDI